MELKIYKWKEEFTEGIFKKLKCAMCGKQAYRSFYNDSKVGNTTPAWYVCNKDKCAIMVTFFVLDDVGANKER